MGDTLRNGTHHYPQRAVNQCHVHRDEVAKFNSPCSPYERIHVNVNTEDHRPWIHKSNNPNSFCEELVEMNWEGEEEDW